jgi:pimeloyl-ACP methyl ester carboxylesterase
MVKIARGLLFLFVLLSVSCATFNRQNPYPGMATMHYEAGTVYEFRNESSDKLIIHIDGSGWDSALGEKTEDWRSVHMGALLLPVFRRQYNMLILEKWNRNPERNYYQDLEARLEYTMENLAACYLAEINAYLAEHRYSSIVLIGFSEGAALLPLVYEKMQEKALVSAMVSIGFGGLSYYESCTILSTSPAVREDWRAMYLSVLSNYDRHIELYNGSIGLDTYGNVLRYITSLMSFPAPDYRSVAIPVLFMHGNADWNAPVESTRYIQENLPDKPFEYRFYEWGHAPARKSDIQEFTADIAEWLAKILL